MAGRRPGHGEVLDILVQSRRNKRAAKKFFRKLLKALQYVPRVIVTDKLRSYAAAKAEILPSVQHEQHAGLNNRAENSHQPTRERERRMRGFKSPGQAQRFLSAFGVIASFFRPGRHLLAAANYREIMRRRFTQWRELVGVQPAITNPIDGSPRYRLVGFRLRSRRQVDSTRSSLRPCTAHFSRQ